MARQEEMNAITYFLRIHNGSMDYYKKEEEELK